MLLTPLKKIKWNKKAGKYTKYNFKKIASPLNAFTCFTTGIKIQRYLSFTSLNNIFCLQKIIKLKCPSFYYFLKTPSLHQNLY